MPTSRTVLIFAHECAPYHRPQSMAAAQRPAQFAKHLTAFGWRAIVLCCDTARRGRGTAADFAGIDEAVRRTLDETPPGTSAVIATPSWPSDGLLDAAWRGLLPDGRPSVIRDWCRKPLTLAKFFTGDYSQPWQPFARRAAAAVAAAARVDVCVGEHGPDAGLLLARWFSDSYGVPWLADFRDPILQPLKPLARRLYRPWVRHLLSSATATINVTPYWATLDAREFGRRAHDIPNGYDPDEFAAPGQVPSNDRFTLAYFGSITAAQRIDLFLEALALACSQASGAMTTLRFRYAGAAVERVRALAERYGVSRVVEATGPLPRDAALAAMGQADMLLLLSVGASHETDVYFAKGYYPAKTFEYFGARRPILCVPGDHALLERLITETRTGVVHGSATSIATHILESWRVWRAGGTLRIDRDESAVAAYTRRHLAGKLAHELDGALAQEASSGSSHVRDRR